MLIHVARGFVVVALGHAMISPAVSMLLAFLLPDAD